MPFFESSVDSARLYYRAYTPDENAFRRANPVKPNLTLVFLHGWPMSSRMFDNLIVPLCETHRFRCIAPDRRGFGQSDWNNPLKPITVGWDTFVADLKGVLELLNVEDFVFVAASMGCTESLLAYQADEIRKRCKGLMWIGPIMPFPLYTPENPLAPTNELWTSILDGFRANRAVFTTASLPSVFAMHAGNEVHPKVLEHFERIISEADSIALEKTVAIFTQTSEEEIRKLAKEPVPLLILHGDEDQGMPMEASSKIIKEMVPWAELKVYKNGGHGIYLTHQDQLMVDLLEFIGKI